MSDNPYSESEFKYLVARSPPIVSTLLRPEISSGSTKTQTSVDSTITLDLGE